MRSLGALNGQTSTSSAFAANRDGSVVVGEASNNDVGGIHAFRWVQTPGTHTGVMQDLGSLQLQSFATAVSADGAVVVGGSTLGFAIQAPPRVVFVTRNHAFRWTQAGGMTDLGLLPGHTSLASTMATGVSGNGEIVVGIADPGGGAFRHSFGNGYGLESQAFRWTSATGMRSLDDLLQASGVDMTGVRLLAAHAISEDGRMIVGAGLFPQSPADQITSYVVRYIDAATDPLVIGGVTIDTSVQDSVDQLAGGRLRVMAQHRAFAGRLLGEDEPIANASEAAIFASTGSFSTGAFGRISLGNGFSVAGGIASTEASYRQVDVSDDALGAISLRYTSESGSWRPYAEFGAWTAPSASFEFSRTYANGAGVATGRASTGGSMSFVYGRAGVAATTLGADQLTIFAEFGRERLETDAYGETLSSENPFEASVSSAIDEIDIARVGGRYTRSLSKQVDTTIWIAAAALTQRSNTLNASIPGFGRLEPTIQDDLSWAEYGARVGWRFHDDLTLDGFVAGMSGDDIGAALHSGAMLRLRF
jgi:hypothetical protein